MALDGLHKPCAWTDSLAVWRTAYGWCSTDGGPSQISFSESVTAVPFAFLIIQSDALL